MTSEQLDGIIDESPAMLGEIMSELHPKILEAASAALEATQDTDDGGSPKVSIGLKVVIDLSTSPPTWQPEGSVGVRYKVKGEANSCEATPELAPGMGKGRKRKGLDTAIRKIKNVAKKTGGVTITSGGKSVSFGGEAKP